MTFLLVILSSLQGQWQQSCLNGNANSENFTDKVAVYTESFFADSDCSRPYLSFVSQGTYSISGRDLDFEFSDQLVLLQSQASVDDYNARSVCGWNDWQFNSPRSVIGEVCDFLDIGKAIAAPQKGQVKYGIYKIEQSKLYFGLMNLTNDGSTPGQRPVQWDPRYFTSF